MFYYLPISSRAVARSEVKFAIICEKISHWYAESLYKLSFNSNCFAWSLHLDDVINKLLKRLLVSFKPIANSLEVMDHYNFDTWRKLDFCSGDRNFGTNILSYLKIPWMKWWMEYFHHQTILDPGLQLPSCWPATASFVYCVHFYTSVLSPKE